MTQSAGNYHEAITANLQKRGALIQAINSLAQKTLTDVARAGGTTVASRALSQEQSDLVQDLSEVEATGREMSRAHYAHVPPGGKCCDAS